MRMSTARLLLSFLLLPFAAACGRSTAEHSTPVQTQTALTDATIKWPAPGSEDKELAKGLLAEDRAAIARTPMPVLWPAAKNIVRSAYVAQDAYYSIAATSTADLPSGNKSVATINVQGTRKFVEHEDFPKNGFSNRTYRNKPAFFTVNEGIVSATWIEFGVSYTVDVECSTAEDARCGGDGYVQELVESLRFVGGLR